jgi:hypothetical protein
VCPPEVLVNPTSVDRHREIARERSAPPPPLTSRGILGGCLAAVGPCPDLWFRWFWSFWSPRAAATNAQAAVDADEEAESYVEVGEDPDGVRYALLDASGNVTSEMVFRDQGGDWTVASEDTCA